MGKKPGDTATVEFSVEDDPQNKELCGKKMRYEIEILGIMKKLPLNLLTKQSLKLQSRSIRRPMSSKKVMSQLKAAAEQHSQDSLKDSAVEKLCSLSEVELPDTLYRKTETGNESRPGAEDQEGLRHGNGRVL